MTDQYRELLIGCGHSREKRVFTPDDPLGGTWKDLTTLDINPTCKPDVVFDLRRLGLMDLPFDSNHFDELHAYEILEHIGCQGEVEQFFAEFHEYWRVLKPGGYLCATVPDYKSLWAWGDPGHTRVINAGTLLFLSKKQYEQLGRTAMSDYRGLLYDMDFEVVRAKTHGELFVFVLRAIK